MNYLDIIVLFTHYIDINSINVWAFAHTSYLLYVKSTLASSAFPIAIPEFTTNV